MVAWHDEAWRALVDVTKSSSSFNLAFFNERNAHRGPGCSQHGA